MLARRDVDATEVTFCCGQTDRQTRTPAIIRYHARIAVWATAKGRPGNILINDNPFLPLGQ